MKTVAIVQARTGSKRLPAKVLHLITGQPMISLLLNRLSEAKEVDEIILATTDKPGDGTLAYTAETLGFECFRGSEDDVLGRYFEAAREAKADVVVRITGDCPFVDPELVDDIIRSFKQKKVDYCSNVDPPTYPNGLDVEVFSFDALQRAEVETQLPYDREHVTPHFRKPGLFKTTNHESGTDWSALRWTVDELADLNVTRKIYEHFLPDRHFTWQQVLALQQERPEIFKSNAMKDPRLVRAKNCGSVQRN
jgi:glutamate-1-semialdehyde 2,1-aminomutase